MVTLAPCIAHVGRGAAAAVAFCDEPVTEGPPPTDLAERFALARSIAAFHGVHLVDWFACDDQLFRSARTYNGYLDMPVTTDQFHAIWELMKYGPTSANMLPSRLIWCQLRFARS